VPRDPAAGDPHRHPAADQPHHRDHQGHCARHRGVAARDPRLGAERHGDRRQPVAAEPGGGPLSAALHPAGGRQPLHRATLWTRGSVMEGWDLFVDNFLNFESLARVYPLLLQGLWLTVLLAIVAVPLATVLGL